MGQPPSTIGLPAYTLTRAAGGANCRRRTLHRFNRGLATIVHALQHFHKSLHFDPGQFHAADTLILYIRAD
jgi:hypothetical protein